MKAPFVVLSLCVATLTPGCARQGKDQTSVITRRLDGEPKTLNPLLGTSVPDMDVSALLFANLLEYDEKLNLLPGLAESVEADAAHRVYTVKLRPGTRWEDGSAITTKDVAYTLRALMDPKTPAFNRRGFFEGFEKAEVVDDLTCKVSFSSSFAARRDAFNLPLLPAALYGGKDVASHPRNREPLANGPYRLARWVPGQRIELVRNTQYYGDKPPAERIVLRLVPETAPAFQALLSEEIDEMRLNTPEQKRQVVDDATAAGAAALAVRPYVFDELGYTYVGWDNRHPLFSDPAVRRALTALVDRESIGKELFVGLARPSNGPIPPGLWSFDPTIKPWPYDPAAAEAALDAAGWLRGEDGKRRKNGKPFAFTLSFGAGSDIQRQVAEVLQQSFGEAGIDVSLESLEWATFSTKVDAGELPATLLAISLDANPDLSLNWHTNQAPPNGFNSNFYSNPKADALMDRLKTEFDRPTAKALYAQLARIIHEDEPVTFMHTVSVKWAVNRRMENVRTSPIGIAVFWPGVAGWKPGRARAAVN